MSNKPPLKNFSEVQQTAWGKFATQWRDAILQHPMATPWGLSNQTDTERLLTEVFSKVVDRDIRRMAFNEKSPDQFTFDGKVWASISPHKEGINYRKLGLLQ